MLSKLFRRNKPAASSDEMVKLAQRYRDVQSEEIVSLIGMRITGPETASVRYEYSSVEGLAADIRSLAMCVLRQAG